MLLQLGSQCVRCWRRVNDSLSVGWRIAGTGFSFLLFGIGAFAIGALFWLLSPLPFSAPRKQYWVRRSIHLCCRFYISVMKYLGLLSYSIHRRAVIPAGKLLVANHPTLLDAVFILAFHENTCCIMKSALWKHPATAAVARMANYIPNDTDAFIERARARLHSGDNLLIFPEGTRNLDDTSMAFKRGAANIAILTNSDIVPIIIRCQPRTLQKNESWYQVPSRPPHFSFEIDPLMKIASRVDSAAPRTLQYRQLTQAMRQYFRNRLNENQLTAVMD